MSPQPAHQAAGGGGLGEHLDVLKWTWLGRGIHLITALLVPHILCHLQDGITGSNLCLKGLWDEDTFVWGRGCLMINSL